MAAEYHLAPRVVSGDAITSTQFRQLARSFNDRERLNIGNPVWRQVRNPDASGELWPSETEWHEFYSHVIENQGNWPDQGPGRSSSPAMPAATLSPV